MMISTALGLLSAVGSMVGTGVSSAMSSNSNKKALAHLKNNHLANQREYDRLYNSDYLSRTDAMNTLNRRKELASQQYARSRKIASNFGGTSSMLDAENANNNNWINQTYSAIGENAQSFKDGIKNAQMQDNSNYANTRASLLQSQAQSQANAGAQITKAMSGIASVASTMEGGDEK